jgi:hypothetical protein
MSLAAAHESKRTGNACQSCRDRNARYADDDHTLCFECGRRERERRRERLVAGLTPAQPTWFRIPSSMGERSLSEGQVAHRRLMVAHLERHAGAPSGRS